MIQKELNKVNMDEWDQKSFWEEQFRLNLTAKHALIIGKWQYRGEWGIDLREWSYDKARLLAKGIAIDSATWERLFESMVKLEDLGLFSASTVQDSKYVVIINIDSMYKIKTGVFVDPQKRHYFCINLIDTSGKLIWKATKTPIGTMVRFDTIHDFIVYSQEYELISKKDLPKAKKQIDKRTGKQIF